MKKVLILEDNPAYIELFKEHIQVLSFKYSEEIEVEVISAQAQVEAYVNNQPADYYDAILLDYYAADGTFHVLDIEHFGAGKVISISSSETKNQAAMQRGVRSAVTKDYNNTTFNALEIIKRLEPILFNA